MLKGHFTSAGASIDYGDATEFFPVDGLDATVLQYRDAQLALDDVAGEDVVVVAPTSLATSYRLTQHALTAIPIETLPAAVQAALDEGVEEGLDAFELIQIGKWTTDSPNYSLAEFTTA
ncbi:hypothetical protein [Salinibaculum rarum]|uniref:hypothetical protein n=1 Tax=Salinibaculum rarum TaxID=3058903 RepID=UPI00265ECBAA|nr:hypothetical protein [Salinibaculum sp. KK48]